MLLTANHRMSACRRAVWLRHLPCGYPKKLGLLPQGVDLTHCCRKYGFLTKLGEALPGTLELVEGDIMKEGAFDEACKGATYVLHTGGLTWHHCKLCSLMRTAWGHLHLAHRVPE